MSVEAYRPVARSVEQLVNDYLREEPTIMYSDFEPNILMGVEAVKAIEIADESLRWGGPTIRTAIRRVADLQFLNRDGSVRFRFCENPRFRRTLDLVLDGHKKAHSKANESLVIRAAIAAGISLNDTQAVSDMTAEEPLFSQLAASREHQEAVRAANSRQQMIDEITRNGTQGFTLMTQYGGRRVFDKDGYEVQYSSSGGRAKKKNGGFENMSDEDIRQIHAHVMEKRRAIEMAKDGTLAKHTQQLGKEHYQQKFNGDPGSNQPKPAAAAVLTDPRNGQPIMRRIDLINYINSSRDALAKLVKPRGVTIFERARAVDALLAAKD